MQVVGGDARVQEMEDLDTEEYVRRIKELNAIKDSYEFSTSIAARISPDLALWSFLRDEQYSKEADVFVRIMETEQSWEKLRYSKILVKNQIINFNSASELLNLMAAKNFTISHFLKICIEDNLLPYPSDTVSFLHDLNYGYQLLKMVRDIDSSSDRVKRKVNDVMEEFHVVYARVGPEPVTIQIQASGIPSPRYEWFYRPVDDPSNPTEDFTWIPLSATQDNVLYFDPFTFSDSGYYFCRVQHNLCVVAEVTKERLEDWTTSRKIFLRPERGSLMVVRQPAPAECSFGGSVMFECEGESFEELSYQWFKDEDKLIGEDRPQLRLSNLTLENTGNYHCLVSTDLMSEKSYAVRLSVNTSSPTFSSQCEDEVEAGVGEQMVVRSQPELPKYAQQPMAIGEKINLKFEVACGRPVTYEWLKQGVREDVTLQPPEVTVRSGVAPVSHGRELVGEVVEGGEGVTCWQYVCRAYCPSTGETVYSDVVRLRVARATTNECSFPKFKIALVICEEKYQKTAQFPSLRATRNDGESLIRALQELQFQVLAFTNLTLGQLRNAIDLFASFIDEETYALFYYNGHAVGHHEDIYLATVESSLDEHDMSPLSQVLLHHGHVEAVISDKNPLLGVIIYDSCRDDPKEFVKKKLEASKSSTGYLVKSSPNLVLGYGTMPNMKAFEESDSRTGTQIGVYMKHLLNHIRKKDLDIERVFKNVQSDFQRLTAASISEKMKPEYRSSLGQEMYLGASLRQRKANILQKAFFRLSRCEYLFSPFLATSAQGRFEFPQGIKWNQDDTNLSWVHGQVSADNGLDGILTMVAAPSVFFNECEVSFRFDWRSQADLPGDVNVQVVGRNVSLMVRSVYADKAGQQHSLETVYQPCSKDRKEAFLTKDGPLFKLRDGVTMYPDTPMVLVGLQELKDRVKLLLILRTNEQMLVAPGLVCFPLPIMEHTESLVVRDKKGLYAGIMHNL